MTAPANTTKPATQEPTGKNRRETEQASATGGQPAQAESATDRLDQLAQDQQDAAEQAREVTAIEGVTDERNGRPVGRERAEQLRLSARHELLTELRSQEQDQARRQLERATLNGEEAVAGLVEGIAVIVRSMVPPALLRPEDFIETSYVLADQGLRVTRRLALAVAGSARSLTA
jgi:hypothetical protein